MTSKKIIWMADEVIGSSRPRDWETVMDLTRQLISLVGRKDLQHEVLDPRVCWINLLQKFKNEKPTTIIDLSGMFGPALRDLFPSASVVEDFKISRIRQVSSHGLPTSGHVLSLTPDQIRRKKGQLDLLNVLIVDDTSFSGTSSEIAMNIWGLDSSQTSHAFLLANTGDFPTPEGNIAGAVNRLQKDGSKVFFGQELCTPEEDGWHTKDLQDHPNLRYSLEVALRIQQLGEEGSIAKIEVLLHDLYVQQAISSECFDTQKLQRLGTEGRAIISKNIEDGGVHARNPLLWAIPSLAEHIDMQSVIAHKDEVIFLLSRLQTIAHHPEGNSQAREAFRQIALSSITPEGNIRGRESL